MKQIRKRVFETNSSTENAISITQYTLVVGADVYEKWKNNEVVCCGNYDEALTDDWVFVSTEDDREETYKYRYTYENYLNLCKSIRKWSDGDINEYWFTTPSGERFVIINTAFGEMCEIYR